MIKKLQLIVLLYLNIKILFGSATPSSPIETSSFSNQKKIEKLKKKLPKNCIQDFSNKLNFPLVVNGKEKICQKFSIGNGADKEIYGLYCCQKNTVPETVSLWKEEELVIGKWCDYQTKELVLSQNPLSPSQLLEKMERSYGEIKNKNSEEVYSYFTDIPTKTSEKEITKHFNLDSKNCILYKQKNYFGTISDVKKTIKNLPKNMKEKLSRNIIITTLCGLRSLIKADYRHGDIKSDNILCNNNGKCYIHDNDSLISGNERQYPPKKTLIKTHLTFAKIFMPIWATTMANDVYNTFHTLKNIDVRKEERKNLKKKVIEILRSVKRKDSRDQWPCHIEKLVEIIDQEISRTVIQGETASCFIKK